MRSLRVSIISLVTVWISGVAGAEVGARMPFDTVEAETLPTSGAIVRLTRDWEPTDSSPELEASGRAHVELTKTGQYIEIPITRPNTNGLTLRHCIPDSEQGGGITATLSLYVNGTRRQALTLSSEKNWLYGTGKANENGQSETPNAFPHVFWAESQFLLDQPLNPGDMVRLQKDPSDSAAFYRIDCIDLEVVPEPIPQPANSLSEAEYGAAGKDVETDTAALLKCIADAKFQGKTVYLPPGTYLQNQILRLDGVRVQGAGPWYTTIRDTVGNTSRTWTDSGIKLGGESPALLDLTLEGAQTRRPNGCVAISSLSDEPRNWLVQNVWIKTYGAGIWVGGFDGTVRNCRVRNTYADGITINNGKVLSAERILIENNHVRGCGDDGIAVHSFEASPNPSHHCIIRNNTVVAVWWGSNIAIGGGSDHLIENNLSQDGIGVGLAINMPNAYKKRPAENITIRNNTILRAGTNKNSQRRGAIWINPGYVPVISATIEGNTIVDAIFRGIHVTGPKPSNLTITGNTFINPRGDAIYINPDAAGAATISGNVIQNAKQGAQEVNNRSSENFTLTVQ